MRRNQRVWTGLLAAGLLGSVLTAGPAQAQQGQNADPALVIAYLDKDGDGKCSLNEYLTYQVGRIAEFDEDGDGELSRKEFKASLSGGGKQNADRSFDAFNRKAGRSLDQKEFLSYHAYVFKEFVDTNSDGFMSADEWAKIMKSVR